MSNAEITSAMRSAGMRSTPVTESTRAFLISKLAGAPKQPYGVSSSRSRTPDPGNDDDDDNDDDNDDDEYVN
jgi:hypothetical protein